MGGYSMDIGENIGGLYKPKPLAAQEIAASGTVGDVFATNAGFDMSGLKSLGIDGNYSTINPTGEITGSMVDGKFTALPKDGFTLGGIGSTMQGVGAIASAAAGAYDAHNKKKYQDKIFGMEEQRVARATARQDKQQAAYDKVFG